MSENLLQIQNAAKAYGSRHLFEGVNVSINEDEHVGVIGPNGAGKTTLFKILIDEEELDEGKIIRSNRLRLGYLSQHDEWEEDETGLSYLEKTIRMPLWEVLPHAEDLGLTDTVLNKRILSLSGGYRMRIKLLSLVGQDPNLLLLDEPTNYLDLETTLLMERFLQKFEGAFLLISHDREFLRRTTDHILEVENQDMVKYNGNIDDYFEQKELLRSQLEAQAIAQDKKKKDILDFVARFGAKATKAKQAQSRLRTLGKMEAIEIKPLPRIAAIRVPPPIPTGKMTLTFDRVSLGYGENTILKNVSLQIARGDHVAVIGLNGAGKSTLLKGISGALQPKTGAVEFGYEVKPAFFAQHVIEDLNADDTVMSSLMRAAHKEILPQQVLDMAGSLLFSGDDVKKKISVLSGGEKSRVALGRILLKKASCLVLDEPTNHLDFQTVEALTLGLQSYTGTVIVVSHDRGFVRRVGTKILGVSKGGVRLYPGTYDEYVYSLGKSLMDHSAIETSDAEVRPEPEVVVPSSYEQKKEREKRIRFCQKRVGAIEDELAKIKKQMSQANEDLVAEPARMDLVKKLAEYQAKMESLEQEWMSLAEELGL